MSNKKINRYLKSKKMGGNATVYNIHCGIPKEALRKNGNNNGNFNNNISAEGGLNIIEI